MKAKYPLAMCAFVLCFFNTASAQSVSRTSAATLGLDFIYNGFYKNSHSIPGRNMILPGVAMNYMRGLSGQYSWSVMTAGCFADSILKDKGLKEKKLLVETNISLVRKFNDQDKRMQPFALAGVGAAYYDAQYHTYIPVGLGIQVRLTKEVYSTLNAQYRFALFSPLQSHTFCSLGISGTIPRKNVHARRNPEGSANITSSKSVLFSDRDHDGIEDRDDKCPEAPGFVTNGGCPEVHLKSENTSQADTVARYLEPTNVEIINRLNRQAKYIKFETNSSVLLPESLGPLSVVSDILLTYQNVYLIIEGHTDSIGSTTKNSVLSQHRAEAVADYLISKRISASRITAIGFGETQPLSNNSTEAGRAINRRVAFRIEDVSSSPPDVGR